ncbi:MAG: sigma 54-interacting transcriptional regulator [Methylotetracoccus sp.]
MPLLSFPNPSAMSLSVRASALVFEDPSSQALLERIKLVAPSEINVLIVGETGTGKELVARHVHALSYRRNASFLAVNCGALSENLIESELFGHEKGAFTGAISAKQGWFEAASGGTLFLDEVGDLPHAMQVKLLRVLQEREVVRIGSHKPIPIDVRLIAATNVRLEEAVVAGRFREDLYYRLKVAPLELLPLRKRPGDIMPLAEHFAGFYGHRLGCSEHRFSEEARQSLLEHPWPGNIRELENVIHQSLLVACNNTIRPADLNLSHFQGRESASRRGAELEDFEQMFDSLFELGLPDLYDKIEQAILRAAYRHSHSNQLRTARLLGLSRHVVRARLLQHGILAADRESQVTRPPAKAQASPSPVLALPRAPHRPDHERVSRDRTGPPESSTDWWGF